MSMLDQAQEFFSKGQYLQAYILYSELSRLYDARLFAEQRKKCRQALEKESGTQTILRALQSHGRRRRQRYDIVVAAIMDEFTSLCYAPECQLIQLCPDTWKSQLVNEKPAFLFIESAWKGVDNLWVDLVSRPGPLMGQIVSFCREKGIPTVFWNKEDPIHYRRFLHVAKLVDVVCTVDYDSIAAYRHDLHHANVFLLPFAAQPRLHNPIEYEDRKDAFCFAGSYYPQHEQRQKDFLRLADFAKQYRRLDIYDRNLGNATFAYPDALREHVIGHLEPDAIDKAYKGYAFGININTVTQSSTMFARRVYELLASNTITISNDARGIHNIFGDLILATDDAQVMRERLDAVCTNDNTRSRFRLMGLRKVLQEHTYRHRLAYVLSKLGICPPGTEEPRILMLATVATQEEAQGLRATVQRQQYKNFLVWLVQESSFIQEERGRFRVFASFDALWAALRQENSETFVGIFATQDYYGVHYVEDLTLACLYFYGDGIGKKVYYSHDGSYISLAEQGKTYANTDSLCLHRSMLRKHCLAYDTLKQALLAQKPTEIQGDFLAIDALSYIANGAGLPPDRCACVEDLPNIPTGLPLSAIQATVKDIQPVASQDADLAQRIWAVLEELQTKPNLQWEKTDAGFTCTAHVEKAVYFYVPQKYTLEELPLKSYDEITLHGKGTLDLRLVLVFKDAEENKLGHVLCRRGTTQLRLPPQTQYVQCGLRLEGDGEFVLEHIGVNEKILGTCLLPTDTMFLLGGPWQSDDSFVQSCLRWRTSLRHKGYEVEFLALDSTQKEPFRYRKVAGLSLVVANSTALDKLFLSHQIVSLCVLATDRAALELAAKYKDTCSINVLQEGRTWDVPDTWNSVISENICTHIHALRHRDKREKLHSVQALVYADIDPNVIDGSSIWLCNVLLILAKDYKVACVLKRNITDTCKSLEPVLRHDSIVIVEPQDIPCLELTTPAYAVRVLEKFAWHCPQLRIFVIRAYDIAAELLQVGRFRNILYVYMTSYAGMTRSDMPLNPEECRKLRVLLTQSQQVLVQTRFLAELYEKFLGREMHSALLPPAIPDQQPGASPILSRDASCIHIGYCGKAYPLYGLQQLVAWCLDLRESGLNIRLHCIISKVYNETAYKIFIDAIEQLDFVDMYHKLSREETMQIMRCMDYVWCWRTPDFEESTLEVSSKLIENISLGIPCICYPSKINVDLLGTAYGHYCRDENDFQRIIQNRKFCDSLPQEYRDQMRRNFSIAQTKIV